jgi:hypothetical protein
VASHSRHVLSTPGDVRVQIRFRRTDLLWVCEHGLASPHAAAMRTWARRQSPPVPQDSLWLEVPRLPLSPAPNIAVGPTILDMLVRKMVGVGSLPPATARRLREEAKASGLPLPMRVPVWQARDPDTLWPKPGQGQTAARPDDEAEEDEKQPDHPFLAALVSGGKLTGNEQAGWVEVEKATTVSLSEHCMRLAAGMCGSLGSAYTHISQIASRAWEDDLERAQKLWRLVGQAPGGSLVEDLAIEALRPGSSVSQQVERSVMGQACRWLGVDPDLDLRRGPGRPRKPSTEAGSVLEFTIVDGTAEGIFLTDFHGVRKGTAVGDLDTLRLAEVLGALRHSGLLTDADLLEAYLDAADADWREKAAAGSTATGEMDSPYDVLGVLPDTPPEQVAAAFRAAMQAVQNLPNAAPQRRLIAAFKAIKQKGA